MTGRTATWTKALAALAAAALAGAAHAEAGNGIRLGGSDARLHPFVDLEARYDSNVLFTPANEAIADLILHVRPGLELKAPSELFAVEFSGALDWAQYLGVEKNTSSLSNLYAIAALAAVMNRSGAVSPRIDNSFARQISTTSLSAYSSPVISNANTLSLSVPWKPGGGALVIAANAQWMVESFEKYGDVSGAGLSSLGYNQYRFGGEAQWRFLPRTSGVFQASYFTRTPNVANSPDQATGYDIMAGVTGLMTERIAATAKVGFGGTSTVASTVFGAKTASTVLADTALEWAPFDTLSFKAGYTRSFGLDPTVAAYVADGVSGGFRVKLADRFAFRAGARWDRFAYQSLSGSSTSYLRIDPGIEGQFGRWLNLGVGYVYSMRTASGGFGAGLGTLPDYSKNEAFVMVGFTY